ncbi:MAG: hypothetical protein KKA07_10775, partial [Bacteroidetes bacterium]|nr:hypothetical protein [Bacteroidota bacterium]
WINNLGGTFLCKQGIVTFNGGNAYLYPGGVGAGHQFYDVVVAKNTGNWANIPNGEGGMDIENNFTVQSGTFTTNDNNINIAGSLDVNATFNHNNNSSMLTFDATSGTHTIKSYNNNLRNITIDAPGAIYNLSDDLNMYRPCNLDIVNGKLGLNGKTLIFGENSGAAAGDIYVRAGAELDVNAGSSINFYSRTGELHNFGTLYLVGESGNPAYLTSAQTTAAYLYNVINYSGSTLHANYYMVEKSGFSGIELQSGSTIDATDNFSNGQFSSGGGTAYLTLTDADMGAGITVTGVSFGTGPTYNVNRTVGNGAITFENSTGTFTGEANDNDDADPGTKVMWTFPGGFYWDAGDLTDNTDWNRAANWLGNTVPDGTATAYLEHTTGGVAGAYTVNIQSADATVKILTLDAEGGNAIDLVLNGHTLDITQDIIIGTNTSVTQTTANDTIRVAGNWQEIGTYTPNSGTILFNGTGGTSNIQATSSFNNIVFNASGATYNLSQNTDVNGDVRIWAGTLGGGSYTMTVAGDWQKTNGIFDAATSTVSFDKTGTTTQTISGGVFFNFTTDNSGGGTATKQILSTIVINNDVTIGANTILDGTTKNITVGRHWTNNAGLAGFSQTGVGRVSFNGDVNQTIGNGGLATTFNNIVISGTAGTKTIDRDMNVNGDLSIDNIRVNINTDYLIDGTGPSNTFSMSSGTMFVYGGTNLFPAKGVNHNFPVNMEIINISGGTVYYQADINQDVYPTTYNNIDFRRIAAVDQTKTLTGNITVLGNININDVNTELNVNDFTIFLTGNIAVPTGGKAIDWGSPAPTCTGTLQHEGANWNMDADIAQYNNLILAGTGDKAMLANVTITGNVTVLNGVDIWMSQTNWNNPRTMTCTSAGKSFSLIGDSRLLNATDAGTAVAFPTGFATYSLDVASIVYLDRAAAQTIFTNGGTMTYGNLYVYTNGTATCDGMLDVDGDFLMDDAAVFADGGFNLYFAGANCDFRGYPVPTSTTTFNGPDQSIRNDDGGTNPDNMYFKNLVFAGTGTKTFTNGQDVVYISGNLTVNNSITVDCSGNVSDIHFTGTTWTNNGTFNKTNATVFFEGAGVQNINPGANHSFNAVTFSNGGASAKTIVNNPLNVEYGNFTVDAGATLDMGTFTHTIASVTVANGGTWITNNCNLIFDRDNGNQSICALTAKDVTITPNGSAIGRTKTLTGNWVIDDLTIETNSTLDANNGGNYSITLTGNWTNSGGSFTARAGTVAFESNDGTGKTITSNGSNFFTLNFNQSQTNARIYTMADNFGTNGNLTAGNGATLFLNGKTLTLGDNTGIETHTIQAGGTLYANANATIAVNTNAGHAPLNVSGTLKVIGTSGNNAIIDRSAGGNRIAVTIAAGATIAAEYYHFKYLVDAGMVIVTTATIDDTYNLSNGTWSEMNTAGVQTRYYLDAECSPPSTPIENVTFNYSGTPVIGRHHNVVRRLAGTTLAFDGTISGSLAGETWEADGPAEGTVTPGRITWPAVSEVQWNGSVGADWFDPINWTPNTVPTEFIDAKIPYVSPNDYPKIWAPDAKCRRLRLTNGMLLLTGGFDLAVYSDAIIGESGGAATLAITDPGCEIIVAGSWTKDPAATFNAGGGRVLFVAATGSATITPGSSPFYDIQFNGGATFNIVGAAVDVYHNFTISSGNVTISTGNYNLTIGGDYDNPGGTFSTSTAGTVTFGGADQSITNGTFYNLVIGGTGEKTAYNMLSTANTLVVNSTLTADNGSACSIDINGDATIAGTGTFNDGNQTHYFSGRNWYGTGAYTGSGTVIFDRGNTNSVIIYPSKFNNLTLGCLGSVTLAGDVDVTGDVTVTDSINVFYLSTYLLSSTNGLGTFSLINNEILDVRGADNFPDNFGAYELDTNTYTRYYGTIDQIVAGVGYGNLQLSNVKKRTLDGDITIKGSLWFNNSTLDVSSSNYKISIAGDWNNNSTGSFLCKNGQVVFNGNVYQTIRINGSGTQTFYRFTVDKGGNSTAVINYHATILDFLRVLNGNLNTQDLVVRVGGDILCTSGKILTNNSINSRFILNKSSGSASISTNGSIFRNIDIDAGTTVFTLQDGLTVEMNFNLISGTFDGNGKTVEMSSNGFGCTISGTYKVGNNGTLKIGQNVTFTVASGGSFYAVGTPGIATVTNRAGTQRYTFVVDGTIYAEDYLIEYLAAGGLRISSTGLVDLANNFSNGTFTNGASGGTYLTFESNQAIDGANRIENVSFNYNPLGGAHNVTKTASDIGVVEFYNSSGVFAGEDFDYENVDVIVWTGAVTVSWIGVIDEDWYKSGNWSASSGPAHVPLITDDVIINFIGPPQQPEIHQGGAVAKSIYLSNNATLYLNTPADEANDLEVAGDIDNFGTISCASATDTIIVGGNWTNQATGSFSPSLSTVILNSPTGTKTLTPRGS